MFGSITRLSRSLPLLVMALDTIAHRLTAVLEAWDSVGPIQDRVRSLELELGKWEAEMEAQMTRAESRFSAARSAEERTKRVAASVRAFESSNEGEEDVDRRQLDLLAAYAPTGSEEPVQPVPEIMEIDPKAAARNAKFQLRHG